MKEFTIGKNEAGQRFDKYLTKLLPNATKSFIYKMLRKKNITLNGKKAAGSEILSLSDVVRLFFSDETYAKFSGAIPKLPAAAHTFDFSSAVVYEDDDILIVNKPSGILSQPERADGESLVSGLTEYLLEQGKITGEQLRTFHPAPANRLDRNTSGLILCGISLRGSQFLTEIIKSRDLKKHYLTVTRGEIEDGIYEAYLKKDTAVNKVTVSGHPAEGYLRIVTGVTVLRRAGEYSLLDIDLITGRTHQIRSHLAWLGAPVIGDIKYGDRDLSAILKKEVGLKHQFLHAARITFPVSQGDFSYTSGMSVKAPLTAEEERILEKLGLR